MTIDAYELFCRKQQAKPTKPHEFRCPKCRARVSRSPTKDIESLRNVADRATPLSRGDDGEPSALEKWVNRHGIAVRGAVGGFEMELSRPVSYQEMLKIVRAGIEAAEASPMLTSRFEDSLSTWREPDGTIHKDERLVVNKCLLGVHDEPNPIW